ncbi:MAG TPA: hypothetical protein VFC87_06840 [Perlabentimonas sp.]|nr:hypothetical protein [Perlabentimonas sp.]
MKTLNLIKAIMIISLAVFLSSCEKDNNNDHDNPMSKTTFKFQATTQTAKMANAKTTVADGLVVESFMINIAEIEIEFDEDDPMFETDSVASDYDLEGPFEIDLIKEGNPFETIIASNVELPAAAYSEIEFEFDKNKNQDSDLFGKTTIIEGTINETPFIFWSDEDIELEIEFEELVYLEEATSTMLAISFDLTALFNPEMGGIDITSATDGNGDGIIEIYPGDPDGNSKLAEKIYEKLEDIIEAFEDKYDD